MSAKKLLSEKLEPIWSVGEVALTYRRKAKIGSNYKINSAVDVESFMHERWDEPDSMYIREKFYALFLNRQNRVMSFLKVSEGGVSGTIIDVKYIAVSALLMLASSVIIVHNHPSGNTKPSETDVKITQKLKKGLELLDFTLLDHVVVTPQDGYFSFAEVGYL